MLSLSSSTLASINEAYSSIYEETIEIDLLDQVVEEISLEMIDEGYDIQEIEESFDDDLIQEIIDEAKVSPKENLLESSTANDKVILLRKI